MHYTSIGEKSNNILKYILPSDLYKGREYYQGYLDFVNTEDSGKKIIYNFLVESETTMRKYEVTIGYDKTTRSLYGAGCGCPRFKEQHSCKHLAACLYHYYDEIFVNSINNMDIENLSEYIFNNIIGDEKKAETPKRKVKEELNLEIILSGTNHYSYYYSRDCLNISIRLGTDKLYKCSDSKLNSILNAISNGAVYNLGKSFTYDGSIHYFNPSDQRIIDYLLVLYSNRNNDTLLSSKNAISSLFKILQEENKIFTLNDYKITEFKREFPMPSNLDFVDDKYHLSFNGECDLQQITGDLKYVQNKNTLYILNEKEQKLLSELLENETYELVFPAATEEKFKNNILPIIKENIEITENVSNIKLSKEIKTKMYFDLYRDKIICNLKFLYDGEEIDYFDTNSTILRDSEFEENVLNDLYECHFSINKNKILLENTEDIGEFLENYLIKLTEKYETYTSSRLKEIKVVKDNKIRSTFSIGQDNIMSYSFDLGDIKSDEIVNILEAFKDKKKYYRLKTGDLIDINNKDIEELDKLVTDMNIGKKELETGKGTIPKYRAIYLDSIKNNNYHIIETDNLFNELIEKFNKYKDCDVNLSAKDKKIAREYQIEGIKWLYTIDKTGFGGILADEMGLGKSIQTIFYIKELLKENKDYKFLIVAPTSLAYNWENEFMKFAPELKYGIMAGKRSGRREKLEHSDNLNVIITTYGLLREDKEIYDKMHFKTFIIDEAQNIRNVNTNITKTVKDVNADTKIALTGTPIENSVLELWSIFDFIMPGFLTNLETFSRKYKIKDFDDDSEEKIKNLQKLISPFILRRRKKDVIKDLPEKIENNIYVELTKEQKKLYVAELEKVQSEMEEILATEGISKARFLILKLLTKLRQICIDPRIVFDNYDGASGKTEEFLNVVKTMTQEGHKILVFTSFRTALELVRKELNKNKITSYIIDGSVSSKKRMELVDKFNNDDTNVFLIMLKAGGTGLNLTSADIVIHLDLWWNPQAENQATDRAHRIGQKNKVQVIKLITKGTIEEKILELQQKKKILSEKLIDENDVNQALDKLTEKDIIELLSFDNDEDY